MRISTKADYAVRALVEIARRADTAPVAAEDVASDQDLPRGFLLVILADLRRAGIVRSHRGKSGGWVLARPADSITVADVFRAVDGPLASVHGLRPEAVEDGHSKAPLRLLWIAVRARLREVLEGVTLADLALGRLPDEVMAATENVEAWQAR